MAMSAGIQIGEALKLGKLSAIHNNTNLDNFSVSHAQPEFRVILSSL
jgi:hypothetical protein